MIHLEFLGHIKTSMGSEAMDVPKDHISVDELFGFLLSSKPEAVEHGFTKYNTLLVLNGGEVFSASSQTGRRLNDGDTVLLVPFSHGG